MRSKLKLAFVIFSLVVTGYGLGSQFQFFMLWAKNHDAGILGGLWSYFNFFTNLSNILAAAALTYACINGCDEKKLSKISGICGAFALYICMAGIIFNLELSQTVSRHSPTYLVNILLHDVTPLLFLMFWIACVPHAGLTLKSCLVWLTFPLVYFAHVMARGALISQYPYEFFNPRLLGYKVVLLNGLEMMTGFFCVGMLFVVFDKLKLHFGQSYQSGY